MTLGQRCLQEKRLVEQREGPRRLRRGESSISTHLSTTDSLQRRTRGAFHSSSGRLQPELRQPWPEWRSTDLQANDHRWRGLLRTELKADDGVSVEGFGDATQGIDAGSVLAALDP